MKRIVAIMFVGVCFLLPATSSADPPGNLVERVAKLEALVASLQAELIGLSTFVTGLENYVAVDTTNNRITFTGVNLQLVNGTGNTYNRNGKGNLIIGYDTAVASPPSVKTGSHNLVIGDGHTYSSTGGFVAGVNNSISARAATVSGGNQNTASGSYSSVSGGQQNTAGGADASSVSGGYYNTASGRFSSVSGYHNLNTTTEGGYAP